MGKNVPIRQSCHKYSQKVLEVQVPNIDLFVKVFQVQVLKNFKKWFKYQVTGKSNWSKLLAVQYYYLKYNIYLK